MTDTMSKRDQMPITTDFIDYCRESFGLDDINTSIRSGIAGKPTFYAEENGQVIGTKAQPSGMFHDGSPIDPAWMLDTEGR